MKQLIYGGRQENGEGIPDIRIFFEDELTVYRENTS